MELLNVVDSAMDARTSIPTIIDVALELAEENREARMQLETLRKVERALRLLRSVRVSDETRRLNDIARRLNEVITETDRLAREIGTRTAHRN
jgi:hypothetical protein